MRAIPLILLPLLACGPKTITNTDNAIIKEYITSQILQPTISTAVYPKTPAWDHEIHINNGITIHIKALRSIGGRFLVHYSDQPTAQEIADPGDYILPFDIRIDNAHKYLFLVAQGYPAIGKTQITLLYQFDIEHRKLVNTFKIRPGIITKPPTPAT